MTTLITDYLPVYFQACKGSDALISGVQLLGLSATPLGNIIGGISVNITQRYRPQIWISWSLMLVGMSLFTLIKVKTSVGLIVLFCLLFGLGNGYVSSFFNYILYSESSLKVELRFGILPCAGTSPC